MTTLNQFNGDELIRRLLFTSNKNDATERKRTAFRVSDLRVGKALAFKKLIHNANTFSGGKKQYERIYAISQYIFSNIHIVLFPITHNGER